MDEIAPAAARRRAAPLALILASAAALALGAFAPAARGYEEKKRPSAATDPTAATPAPAVRTDAARRAADTARRGPKPLAYDLVRFRQNVTIHADERVEHDVVMLGGDLRVD